MSKPRVLLGFTHASDHELEETAGAVLLNLYANVAIYATPPIAKTVLQTKLTAFTNAIAAQEQGGTAATAAKNVAAADLVATLRLLALYVQTVIDSTPAYGLAELLLSGFDAVSTNRARQILGTPAIQSIKNEGAGVLGLKVKAVPHARTYEVQGKAEGDAAYKSMGLYSSTRGMNVTGLTPGAMYTFEVRAVGGNNGYSQWSDPVSHRSL